MGCDEGDLGFRSAHGRADRAEIGGTEGLASADDQDAIGPAGEEGGGGDGGGWGYNLWMLVVLRLVLPVLPATHWSVHNWIGLPPKRVPALPNRVETAVDAKFDGVVLQSEPILVPTAAPRVISVEPRKSWKDY